MTGVPKAGVGMAVDVTVMAGVQEGEGLLVGVSLTGCVWTTSMELVEVGIMGFSVAISEAVVHDGSNVKQINAINEWFNKDLGYMLKVSPVSLTHLPRRNLGKFQIKSLAPTQCALPHNGWEFSGAGSNPQLKM